MVRRWADMTPIERLEIQRNCKPPPVRVVPKTAPPPEVTLGYRVTRTTELAVRFEGEASLWVPRSLIIRWDTARRLVTVPGWFARKNRLA